MEAGENISLQLVNEFNRTHLGKRIYRSIIQFTLFLYTIDPFSIYKRTHKHKDVTRFQLYQSSQLLMEQTNWDRWRERWRKICSLTNIYICFKFSAIVLVQVALYKSRNGPASIESAQINWLVVASQLLANPLAHLPGMTIFLYSLIVAFISYVLIYLPHYYPRELMDSINLRLWLDPTREFKRIDMIIMETLDNYAKPFRRRGGRSRRWRKYSSMRSHLASQESRQIQLQIIGLFRGRYWCLRPIIYTIDWYRAFDRFTLYMSIPMSVFMVHFSVYILHQLFQVIFAGNHEITTTTTFIPINFFRWLTIVEILMGLFLVIPMSLLLIIIFLCNCYSHLSLLNDIKRHLLVCLDELKRMNDGGLLETDHLAATCIMLKSLIRISLSLEELRSNAKFLTEMVCVNMVISSTTCVSILLAANLDGEDLYQFRVFIIVSHWLWANGTLTGCAYIYKCATKLEKITWSMMAELRSRDSKQDWLMFELQVAEFWRRLIINQNFSDSRMSVRPFGVTLTYDRQLQLNFLAVSFASLLRTF